MGPVLNCSKVSSSLALQVSKADTLSINSTYIKIIVNLTNILINQWHRFPYIDGNRCMND